MFRKRKQHTWLSSNPWICDRPNNDRDERSRRTIVTTFGHDAFRGVQRNRHPRFRLNLHTRMPTLLYGVLSLDNRKFVKYVYSVSRLRVSELASGNTIDCGCNNESFQGSGGNVGRTDEKEKTSKKRRQDI